MNNDMSKELQQPEVNLSLEANNHLRAAEKTFGARLKGLVSEKAIQILKTHGKKPLVTAAVLFAIANAGCNNVEQQNTPPPIPPPPATYEVQGGMPSANIPFIDSRTPTPAVSESKGIPITDIGLTKETKRVRDEKRAIYSQLMDDIETSVPKDKRYFVKIGEKGKYQDRALIFTESVEQDGEEVWIAMTRDGLKSFSVKDSFYPGMSNDYIEAFIKRSVDDLRERQDDFLSYERSRLAERGGDGEIVQLFIRESDGSGNFINFRPDPPPLQMVGEAIGKSKEVARFSTPSPEQLASERLEKAKSVAEALKPLIKPPQPPTPPTQPPQ